VKLFRTPAQFLELRLFSPGKQRREGFFGLKGRFCQPRPKAWGRGQGRHLTLKGAFRRVAVKFGERPFQGHPHYALHSQAFGLG
jgi:hypothetical protein